MHTVELTIDLGSHDATRVVQMPILPIGSNVYAVLDIDPFIIASWEFYPDDSTIICNLESYQCDPDAIIDAYNKDTFRQMFEEAGFTIRDHRRGC